MIRHRAKRGGVWLLVVVLVTGSSVWAQSKPKLDPNNAVWAVELGGVYNGSSLTLHLATRDGKVVRAFGTGRFNKASHDVDGSALAIAEGSLKGPSR